MSTQLMGQADLAMLNQAGLPAFLQEVADQKSTLDEQIIGGKVDTITQGDGGIVTKIAGVKSHPMLSIDVVILDAMPRGRDTYRAYYEGVYTEGEGTAPACYSADGRTPSPHAEKPQCANCAQCPKNVSGSGANGEGRACGFFKHVAVAKYPELDRVYRLKVSSRSLFSKDYNGVPSPLGGVALGFTNYAKYLQDKKKPWEIVVTRVSLPKGQTYGFFFTPVGFIQNMDEFNRIKAMQSSLEIGEVLAVDPAGTTHDGETSPTLPAPQMQSQRDKWLSSAGLPQEVKDWIKMVDDATALQYLQQNYPQFV